MTLEAIEAVTRTATSISHNGTGLFSPLMKLVWDCPSIVETSSVPIQYSAQTRHVFSTCQLSSPQEDWSQDLSFTGLENRVFFSLRVSKWLTQNSPRSRNCKR